MTTALRLSKADARKALVRHQFSPSQTLQDAFGRLRSVQFDPIAPVGCNHDLVLQSRVSGYRIGEWEQFAYQDRRIYDGWDKQASLVPMEGWPIRRIFHSRHTERAERILAGHAKETETILRELKGLGPLMPSGVSVKEQKEELRGSWLGPNLSKQILRALWQTGRVMTSGRRKGQHIYDLVERVLPPAIYRTPPMSQEEMMAGLFLDRHRAIGFLRPTASYEVWSYFYAPERQAAIDSLLKQKEIVPVEIEGLKTHATPEFLKCLDGPAVEPRVVFVAPLDQLMWDRKLIQHVFGFDYIWEIYVPEAKRKWGYYVLPVLYGETFVARAEFWCRNGTLELRRWIPEVEPDAAFWPALEAAFREFMHYADAKEIVADRSSDSRVREMLKSLKSSA